ALVHPGPEQALPVRGERPALVVEAAAELVEADHIGAELRERHPTERRGDERRAFDHLQSVEYSVHAITPISRQSRTGCCARVCTRRSIRLCPTASTSIVLYSTSPSNIGARCSHERQAATVTRFGSARVTCESAIPIVWPP